MDDSLQGIEDFINYTNSYRAVIFSILFSGCVGFSSQYNCARKTAKY